MTKEHLIESPIVQSEITLQDLTEKLKDIPSLLKCSKLL